MFFSGFLAVNFLAYMQAYKMLHYSLNGARTIKPEEMNILQKGLVLFTGVNLPKPVNSSTPANFGMGFKNLTYKSGDGVNLSAWVVPHSHPKGLVALFHGHAASKSQLLNIGKAFHDQGYDLFMVDFRGSGDSDGTKTTLGYDEAEDVKASVQTIHEHWPDEKIVLYGQSMGSVAILHAFSRNPLNVKAIILGCPFDSLYHTVNNRFSIMGLPPFPLADLLLFCGSIQLGFNGFTFRPSEDAREVQCPALLLYGALDRNVLPFESRIIFNHLGGVKKSEEFLNCGHESFQSRDPDQWNKAVFGFLESIVH